jgi:hypothetical protein
VFTVGAGELAQLYKQGAAVFRKGTVVEAFGVQQISAGGPVSMFVGKDAVQHQDLFASRVVVARECGAGFVADQGGNLTGLRRANPVYTLA